MLRNIEKGYLAAIVSLSGSGKSTAIEGTRKVLADDRISSAQFHDRTSSPESQKIDQIIQTADLSPQARMHLIAAARRQIVDRRIIPSMKENDVTLTDRYYPCMIAYQAYGEGLDYELVRQTAANSAKDAFPDRIFVLDIPGEAAVERMNARGGEQQIFDAEKVAFHERVRQGYLEQAASDESFVVVDGLRTREEVANFIASTIRDDLRG